MEENERTFWNGHWTRWWGSVDYKRVDYHHTLVDAAEYVLACDPNFGGFTGVITLEVGSGRGVDSIEMARRGARAVLVDSSNTALSYTIDFSLQKSVEVMPVCANAERIPFPDNYFGLVFSQGLMEHPGLMKSLLEEQIRVVKSGGYMLIDVPQLFCIQAFVKWIQIQRGTWPYGQESSYSLLQLKEILEEKDLEYIRSYGWEIMPILNLGIRTFFNRFIKSESKVVDSKYGVNEEDIRKESSIMVRLGLSPFGPLFLSNVGVIARKK